MSRDNRFLHFEPQKNWRAHSPLQAAGNSSNSPEGGRGTIPVGCSVQGVCSWDNEERWDSATQGRPFPQINNYVSHTTSLWGDAGAKSFQETFLEISILFLLGKWKWGAVKGLTLLELQSVELNFLCLGSREYKRKETYVKAQTLETGSLTQ